MTSTSHTAPTSSAPVAPETTPAPPVPTAATPLPASEPSTIAAPRGGSKKNFNPSEIFAWDADRLVVTDFDARQALTRPALSPSTAKAMHGCVARWALERIIKEDSNPFSAAEVGTSGHSVLEELMALPAFARTRDRALLILEAHKERMWPGRDEITRAKAADWQTAVQNAINGLWAIEDPRQVEVLGIEIGFDQNATVRGIPFTGFIDRLDAVIDEATGEKRLRIVDYKALALDTVVPTPSGYSTIGALKVGDEVLGLDGAATRVVGKSTVFTDRPCWQVTFSSGAVAVADDQHRWPVIDSSGNPLTWTTADLARHFDASGAPVRLPAVAAIPSPSSGLRFAGDEAPHILDVAPVASVPTQCISVDSPDETFLITTSFVPSKNTGKVPKDIGRYGDDHGDQMRLYAAALNERDGQMPMRATLLYTQHGKWKDAALNKQSMSKTLTAFEKSWADLNRYTEAASYPTQDGNLCGWCLAVNSCPVAAQNGRVDRTGLAPTQEFLGIPTLRVLPPKPQATAADEFTGGSYVDFDDAPAPSAATLSAYAASSTSEDFGSASVADTATVQPHPAATTPAAPVAGPLPATPPNYDPSTIFGTAQFPLDPILSTVHSEPGAAHVTGEGHIPVPTQSTGATGAPIHTPTGTPMTEQLFSEDRPYEETSRDLLNANSYAATAVFGTTAMAYDAIASSGHPLTKASLDALSKTFLFIVREVHVALGTKTPSLMDGLNTRLRGLLHSYIDAHPIPWGRPKEEWDAWATTGIKHLTILATAAHRLYVEGPGANTPGMEPWGVLATPAVAPVAAPAPVAATA